MSKLYYCKYHEKFTENDVECEDNDGTYGNHCIIYPGKVLKIIRADGSIEEIRAWQDWRNGNVVITHFIDTVIFNNGDSIQYDYSI